MAPIDRTSVYRDATPPAMNATEGIRTLLDASRKRSLTVQVMPEGEGMRFEVIRARDGELLRVAHVSRYGDVSFEEIRR